MAARRVRNPDEEVVVVGGSGTGADTAVIMKPAYAAGMFETKFKAVFACRHEACRPRVQGARFKVHGMRCTVQGWGSSKGLFPCT